MTSHQAESFGRGGKKSNSSSTGTLKVLGQQSAMRLPPGGAASLHAQVLATQSQQASKGGSKTRHQPASHSFLEMQAEDVALNTGGKSTQPKNMQEFADLSGFKNAKQSIVRGETNSLQQRAPVTGGEQGAPSKKRGVTQQNVQNMINSKGLMIASHSSSVPKTNPPSMRDKIKMEDSAKKTLTPREGPHVSQAAHAQTLKAAGSHGKGDDASRTTQEGFAFSSELVSCRTGGTSGKTSVKHHESVTGVSSSTTTHKGHGKRGMGTSAATGTEKKHSASKKLVSSGASKNGSGRGASGSIDMNTGTVGLSHLKQTKNIHGQRVAEVTVQASASTSKHASSNSQSLHQIVASKNILDAQAKPVGVTSAVVSTPQKFRVKNAPTVVSAKKQSKHQSSSLGLQVGVGERGTAVSGSGPYHQHERDSSETQRLSGAGVAGKSTGTGHGATRKVNLLRPNLSKITSEKKLIVTGVSDGTRVSPRDKGTQGSIKKESKKNSSVQHHRLATTGKKGANTQAKSIQTRLSQQSYMNEYLAQSQKNMKQLQQFASQSLSAASDSSQPATLSQHEHSHPIAATVAPPSRTSFSQSLAQMALNDSESTSAKLTRGLLDPVPAKPEKASKLQKGAASRSKDECNAGRTLSKDLSAHESNSLLEKARRGNTGHKKTGPILASGFPHESTDTEMAAQGGALPRDIHNQKNLFYRVQTNSFEQEGSQDGQHVEYCEEVGPHGAITTKSPLNRVFSKQSKDGDPQGQPEQSEFARDIEEQFENDDTVPVVAELIEDNVIFSQTAAARSTDGGQLDSFVEHRNPNKTSKLDLNTLSGQKTETFERKDAHLFKQKVQRSLQVKSLIQPTTQVADSDNFIYNARSGAPSKNFNFARNNPNGTRPTSTKQSAAPKTLTCWTGSLAQAQAQIETNYTQSSARVVRAGVPGTTKAAHQRSSGNMLGNWVAPLSSQASSTSHYKHLKSSSMQVGLAKGNVHSGTKTNSSHSKTASQSSKDVYKATGKPGKKVAASKAAGHGHGQGQVLLAQRQAQRSGKQVAVQSKSSASLEVRSGSQSLAQVTHPQVQSKPFGLIQVPLSRAELNNQSAYHLADAQMAHNSLLNASLRSQQHHQLHQSLSCSKEETKAFNKSLSKVASPAETVIMAGNSGSNLAMPIQDFIEGCGKQRANTLNSGALVSSRQNSQAQNTFRAQHTVQGTSVQGGLALVEGQATDHNQSEFLGQSLGRRQSNQVFSRSQSNQQISATQAPNSKRQTNSQSRGKQRDNLHQQSNKQARDKESGAMQHQSHQWPKQGAGVAKSGSTQVSKLQRKNQNNLKMQTMQLREQDFKKITSQIESQTFSNAKKKKLQFHSKAGSTHNAANTHASPGAVSSQGQSRQHQAPATSYCREGQQSDLTKKFLKTTSKIYSPHRRSIQQVSSQSMAGAYLNPIEGGADFQSQEVSTLSGPLKNTGQGQRKFAYSLTDKYLSGLDELVHKRAVVFAASHASSSDGGASGVIPSETEKFEPSEQASKVKVKRAGAQETSKNQKRIKSSSNGDLNSKRSLGNGKTSSHGALLKQHPHNSTSNQTSTFLPDAGAVFAERKRSSLDRAFIKQPIIISQQNIEKGKGRGHQNQIEPHRLVKVSKPFHAHSNTFGSQSMAPQNQASKSIRLQMPQPSALMITNPNQQKKGGSFGGGFEEPTSVSLKQNFSSFAGGHQTKLFATERKGTSAAATAPVSHNSTQNHHQIQMDVACQSPQQPTRKNQVHTNSHGPGSLIAHANFARLPLQPAPAQFEAGTQNPGSFLSAKNESGQGSARVTVTKSTKVLPQATQVSQTQLQTAPGGKNKKSEQKSPSKMATQKLSQKIKAAGYTAAQTSTATRKILSGGPASHSSNQIAAYQSQPINSALQKEQQRKVLQEDGQDVVLTQKQGPLAVVNQQSSDRPLQQNIQLLSQGHHKQITTASKGKDSGSAALAQGAPAQGKSFSVLIPSAESVAISKAMLLDSTPGAEKTKQSSQVEDMRANKLKSSFASQKDNERRPAGSMLLQDRSREAVERHGEGDRSYPPSASQQKQLHPTQRSPTASLNLSLKRDSATEIDDANDERISEGQTTKQLGESKKTSFAASSNQKALKVIEERLESQDSAVSDSALSPRSRIVLKLQKKIRLSFLKSGRAPETQTENYKIGKVMGKGAFGKVNLAIHRLAGKFVALKSINKQFLTQEQSKRKVMQEFNILRRTRHCNIVRLYESFETSQHIVFVMEVCGGGDLLSYVRRRRKLKEETARFLFRQVVTGLAYCHTKGVLHRDIKLDNILLTSQGDVKICDFGVSKLVEPGEKMHEQCGTPAYIAPEVFRNRGYSGFASDIWSAGVVLYAMLFGAVPFKASNMAELHKQVLEKQPTYKEEDISCEALQLLKGILEKDPARRLTSEEILEHDWMQPGLKKAKVSVFTKQEKDGIVAEFEYYNKREKDVVVDGEHQVIPTDPFAEQMLSSTQNSELKNVSTRSIILAPFNSTRSQLDYDEDAALMNDLLLPKHAIKYSARVKEIDRQYELNNNADLDNGVYHQDDEEPGQSNQTHALSLEESKEELPPGSNAPRPTEERAETRLRSRVHDEASIADSFNQEQLQSQLDELLDAGTHSVDSGEFDEGRRKGAEQPKFVSPASHARLDSEGRPLASAPQEEGRKKLSAWRQLERQMIRGDASEAGSPPKQSLCSQKIFEEIKGDRAVPDSGDLGQDLEQESYEQVLVELCEDDLTPVERPSKLHLPKGEALAKEQRLIQLEPSAGVLSQATVQQTGTALGVRPTLVIEEGAVREIEKSGYPRAQVMSSLNNDELNHLTTFYYLLQTQKEY